MGKFIGKLIRKTKGMEALQSVILAAVGVILAVLLNNLGSQGMTQTGAGATKIFDGAGK